MFDEYVRRMERRGSYMGEVLRNQSNHVVDATWMNSTAIQPVMVKIVDTGLPTFDEFKDEIFWARFESKSKYNITGDEVSYYLTFRPTDMANHPALRIGSYVSIPNNNNEREIWLIVHVDNDNELPQMQVLKCNWVYKWVVGGRIYNCLGCQRYANSYNSGIFKMDRTTMVENLASAWMPTNSDTNTIGYDQRMIISNEGRFPPLVYSITKIEPTTPEGVTKFRFEQNAFDPAHDDAELMLANYYDSSIKPEPLPTKPVVEAATITYSGTTPTVKVGGSYKTFTASFSNTETTVQSWSINDGVNDFSESTENYTIRYDNGQLKLKVAQKYHLIDTVLTIRVFGNDGSVAEIKVEVVG